MTRNYWALFYGETRMLRDLLLSFSKAFQVFEALFLVHVGMQRERTEVQDNQESVEPLDAVDAVSEHHGATRILKQEVVQVEVLLILLTMYLRLSQALHGGLLPREVDDLRFGLNPHLLHQDFQFAPVLQLFLLLLQDAAGQTVHHGQSGGEHKRLSGGVEVGGVEHLQEALQLCKVTLFYHAVGFINNQTSAAQHSSITQSCLHFSNVFD